MIRSWRYLAGWLAVTVTAVGVSWFGVRLGVAPALTDEPPVAIDADRRYTEIRFGVDETVPPPSPPTVSPSARPSAGPSAGSSKATPSRTTATPSRPAVTSPAATVPASVTPSPSPSAVDRRPRYRVTADGGSIVVAYSATRVDIVDADPQPGYTASGARRGDTVVVARLSGPGHTSVITAYWSGGPAAQVIEEYGS